MIKAKGIDAVIIPPEIDETIPADMKPLDAVRFLALKKALYAEEIAVKKGVHDGEIAIAADTIVVYDNNIIGKPRDRDQAYEILKALNGNMHTVLTGVAILIPGTTVREVFYESTDVFFRAYTDADIMEYIKTQEPYDKAGGYAIQGAWGKHIDRIDGDFDNVVGFPWARIQNWLLTHHFGSVSEFAYQIAVTLSEDKTFLSSPLGTRTAGSRAEHAAAEWLAGKMREIGLTDVEKVAANCDLWQFNGACLQILGDDKIIDLHSYAAAATPVEGITAELLYAGQGTRFDYDKIDARGKIVLIEVNQRDDWWITYPMLEAQHRGALAIVCAQSGGYSEIGSAALNCHNMGAPLAIPCVSISTDDANELKEKLAKRPVRVTLKVDNEVVIGGGVTYNVVGLIAGKSSKHQIIFGAHYDMYFQGFQDNNCSVGAALAIAKAMIDSGYVPENDILFCLHGAEEWGASGTIFDWCVGAWEMINHARSEWQGKTLAFINIELPAYRFAAYTATYSAPEMFSMLDYYTNTDPLSPKSVGCFPEGVLTDGYPLYTHSDDFSYCAAGVPSTVNGFLFEKDRKSVFRFYKEVYHTQFDTKDTYNSAVMDFNIRYYGAFGIYIDRTPALYLDFTAQFDRLSASADPEMMRKAGVEPDVYRSALEDMNAAAKRLKAEVIAINEEYSRTQMCGKDENTLADIWARGKVLTDKNLKIFKFAQDAFLGLMYERPIIPRESPQYNISMMEATVSALEDGNIESAVRLAEEVNNNLEFVPMYFSPEVEDIETNMIWGEDNRDNLYWGTGKLFVKAKVSDASRSLMDKSISGQTDFTEEIAIYQREIKAQYKVLLDLVNQETEDIKILTQMLKMEA